MRLTKGKKKVGHENWSFRKKGVDDSDGCCQVSEQEVKYEQANKNAGQVREQQKSEFGLSKTGHW